MRHVFWLACLVLSGCIDLPEKAGQEGDPVPDCRTVDVWLDGDGDGFGGGEVMAVCKVLEGHVREGGDCNDGDPDIAPGVDEVCDGLDNNCDSVVDNQAVDQTTFYRDRDGDGYGTDAVTACLRPPGHAMYGGDCNDYNADRSPASVWYIDRDGDGHGDSTDSAVGCNAPDGYVALPSDCDDDNRFVNPAFPERCNNLDDDCDGFVDESDALGSPVWYPDADGDGFGVQVETPTPSCTAPVGMAATADDCNDADAGIHPGSRELCDGIDQNCNGVQDENALDATAYFVDADGDGFGEGAAMLLCAGGPDMTRVPGDCDDQRADTHPSAIERCDGRDNNCDLLIDTDAVDRYDYCRDVDGDGYGDPTFCQARCFQPQGFVTDATDCNDNNAMVNIAPTWHADADGDGFGSPTDTVAECTMPAGYLANADDCDDSSALAFPGAPEPDCSDPVDYNCDGSVGSDDADADGFTACTDCNDTDSAIRPDAVELCDEVDNDCDGTVDIGAVDADTWYADFDADGFGTALDSLLACAAPLGRTLDDTDCDDTNRKVFPEAVELCNGIDDNCNAATDEDGAADGVAWYVDNDNDGFGDEATVVVSCTPIAGRITDGGDCVDDDASVNPLAIEICDDGVDNDCDGSGKGCVMWGEMDATDADAVLFGADYDHRLAGAWPVGDMTGDGQPDFAVRRTTGSYMLSTAAPTGDLSAAALTWLIEETDPSDAALGDLVPVGDVTGDGVDDLMVGVVPDYCAMCTAPDVNGVAWLIPGPMVGSFAARPTQATFQGSPTAAGLGALVGSADANVDGALDVLLGSSRNDGSAYLFLGPIVGGPYDETDADARIEEPVTGIIPAADLTGDGQAEIILQEWPITPVVPHADPVHVIDLPFPMATVRMEDIALATFPETEDADRALDARTGDITGDGYLDLVLAAPSDDTADRNAGMLFVVPGPLDANSTRDDATTRIAGHTFDMYLGTEFTVANVDGDAHDDIVVGDARVDAAYLFSGGPTGLRSSATPDARVSGSADSGFGTHVQNLGDLDLDGVDDVAIGAPQDHYAGFKKGSVYLFYGGSL